MTRKDYLIISKCFANIPWDTTKQKILSNLCYALKDDNINFDSDKFLKASEERNCP